jgi:hypothetical protein
LSFVRESFPPSTWNILPKSISANSHICGIMDSLYKLITDDSHHTFYIVQIKAAITIYSSLYAYGKLENPKRADKLFLPYMNEYSKVYFNLWEKHEE